MTISRGDLRRAVASAVGDLRVFEATSATTDGTTFICRDLLMENGTMASRDALCVSGANVNERRIVQSNVKATRSLVFADAFPSPFAVGDDIELYNYRGVGWNISEYNEAINNVMFSISGKVKVPIVDDRGTLFNQADPYLDIPDEFVWLEGVQFWRPYYDDSVVVSPQSNTPLGEWVQIDAVGYAGGAGWWIEPATNRIAVAGRWSWMADTNAVRLIGRGTPAPMYDDADTTEATAEYLIPAVGAYLLTRSLRNQMTNERSQQAQTFLNQMAQAAPRLSTRLLPGAVRVR